MSEKPSLFAELKRRNVIRMAGLYLVAAWLITQVAATLLPGFEAPPWVFRVVVLLLAVGFAGSLVFAWVFEITPEGIRRESEVERHESITHETGRRMDRVIIAAFALAAGFFVVDRFMLAPKRQAKAVAEALEQAKAAAPSPAPTATAPAAPGAPDGTIPLIESDPSIAVLPLVNMSSDKEQEYFSDGISEELLNLLAKVPKLRVIARTSSFSFKGQNLEVPEIARKLHVASVLEGSVRKSGETVRITVQLIRASDGSHLWSETYDRTLDDIFKVQDEIAAAVVQQLQIKLLGAAPTAKPVDPKAYPLILQAQALHEQVSAAGRVKAIELNRQALAISPHEARAYVGLARAYVTQVAFGELPATDGAALAREAANKALEFDPANAAAFAALGRIAGEMDYDLAAAARYFQRALAAEPGNLYVLNNAAILLLNIGRLEEGLKIFEYRIAQDPASPGSYNNLGIAQYYNGRWDDAIRSLRTAIGLSPDLAQARYQIGLALLAGNKDAAGALREFEAEQDELTRTSGIPMALHALGRAKEADAALETFVGRFPDQSAQVALTYAYLGRVDKAFGWLNKAVAVRDPLLAPILAEPLLRPLHGDARWMPLLRRAGYAPEQVAKIELEVTLPK